MLNTNQLKKSGKEFNISPLRLKSFTTQNEKSMLLDKEDNISKLAMSMEDKFPQDKFLQDITPQQLIQSKLHMLLEQLQTMSVEEAELELQLM